MNADGTEQVRLTVNSGIERHPAWSPDGSKIAYQTDRDCRTEIDVMNTDGAGQIHDTLPPGKQNTVMRSPEAVSRSWRNDRTHHRALPPS